MSKTTRTSGRYGASDTSGSNDAIPIATTEALHIVGRVSWAVLYIAKLVIAVTSREAKDSKFAARFAAISPPAVWSHLGK
jgi:hypothetical protein